MTNSILKIIGQAAIEAIAKKHNTTVDLVMVAYHAGNEVVVSQFTALVKKGVETAIEL